MNLRKCLRKFQLLAISLLCHESTDLTPNVSITRRYAFCHESKDLTPIVTVNRQPVLCHESTDLAPNTSVIRRLAFMPCIYGLDSEWALSQRPPNIPPQPLDQHLRGDKSWSTDQESPWI